MMRILPMILCFVIPAMSFSQDLPEEEQPYYAFLLVINEGLEKMNRADYPNYVPLKLSPKGVEPVAIMVHAISAEVLYLRALQWVEAAYKYPGEAVTRAKASRMIRVSGYSPYKGEGYGFEYELKVWFKDGRYRVAFTVGPLYEFYRKKSLRTYEEFFIKKDGSIKPEYANTVKLLEKDMNTINGILHVYLNGKKLEDKSHQR